MVTSRGQRCVGEASPGPGTWPVRPLQWNATANMRVRREWEEWVTRGVRKERNLDAGNGEWGMGEEGKGRAKRSAMIFTRARGSSSSRKVRTAWMGSVTRGGLEALRRGKERRERAQKSRPSNLEQSIRFPQMSHLPGRPRLDAVLAVPALPCTSGNRNDGPLPWQTNKLQTHSHTPTLRIQANSRGPLRSQYRRPHSLPWLPSKDGLLYKRLYYSVSLGFEPARPMAPMAPCARPMLPMADNAKPTGPLVASCGFRPRYQLVPA